MLQLMEMNQKEKVWNYVGMPKESGVYLRESSEDEENYYCYYDNQYKLWLQGYSDMTLAKEKAVEWMLFSKEERNKKINKMSSSWQKLSWSAI